MNRKKIGVLTFHKSYNYGAFMQCYSFVLRLKRDFPETDIEVIDYSSKKSLDGYQEYLGKLKEKEAKRISIRNKEFENDWKYLPLSKSSIVGDDQEQFYKEFGNRYDIIIVGSDAVFNWNRIKLPNVYFLNGEHNAKKLSYAASCHGLDYRDMSDETKIYLKNALKDFSYIGVRDTSTEDLIGMVDEKLSFHHNCDPTTFLDVDALPVDIESLKEKLQSRGVDFSKKLIGLMAGNHIGREIKKRYGKQMQIIALYEPNKYADVFLYDLSPLEWAKVFSFFDIVVTHYFHGTMLALRNLKPVISIEMKNSYTDKYTTKLEDLLTRLKLTEFYYVWDRNRMSFLDKALMKLGMKSDQIFWREVLKNMDYYLENPPKNRIRLALENEEKNYQSFYISLRECINVE